MRRRALVAIAGAALLPGCGFRPVYMRTASGGPGVAARELAAIDVDIIPDRPGQLLRQALQKRFEGSGGGVARRYELGVNYSIGGEGIAIQQDNAVTRVRFIARGAWTLRAQDPPKSRLTSGSARAVDGVNILNQQFFAADLETEVVQRRLAEQIADQITIQLASYFRKQAATAAAG
jgi:LPS-assembly lipoprotein